MDAEEEQRYWIYVSGVSDAAVLFDRSPEVGGEPVLLLRSDSDKAESAKGLNLGMLFQCLTDMKRCPPDFNFVGTEKEALLFVRRDVAVDEFQRSFLYAFDRDFSSDLRSELVREAEEKLGQDGVLARITELGLIPIIRGWVEKMRIANSHGEADVKDFRERILAQKADKMRKLFFDE